METCRHLHSLTNEQLPENGVKKECTHVYYVYPLILDDLKLGVHKNRIVDALKAEGLPIASKYCNLHLMPMYQRKIAYGSNGFPWNSEIYKGNVSYHKGICPVAETLQDRTFIGIGMCVHDYSDDDIDLIVAAFHKVWRNMEEIKKNS